MFRGEEKVVMPLVRLRGLNLGASLKGTEKKDRENYLVFDLIITLVLYFYGIFTRKKELFSFKLFFMTLKSKLRKPL